MNGDLQTAARTVLARCIQNGECIEVTSNFTHNGYGRMRLNDRKVLVHRVIYEAHKGTIPAGMQVMHSCDNCRCCNPDHLSVGTGQDNTNDRKAKDRLGFKINTAHAKEIVRLVNNGYRQSEVAKMFGIHQSMISRISRGKKWAHVHDCGGTEAATVVSVY
jgi:predicted XRE-type DNA-binding protein